MPLPALAAALAERCGVSAAAAEAFVAAVTDTITAALRSDGVVKIKGLGTFSTDSEGNPSFEADPAVAAEINAPFSIFEPVELDGTELPADDLPDEILSEEVTIEENREEAITEEEVIDVEAPEEMPVEEPEEEPVEEPSPEEPDSKEPALIEAAAPTPPTTPTPPTPPITPITPNLPKSPITPKPSTPPAPEEPRVVKVVVREHPWLTGILAALAGIMVGLAAGYFLYPELNLKGAGSVEVSAGYVNVTSDTAPRERDEAAPAPAAKTDDDDFDAVL
ncbi:MAG: HU family DNA-binding protein, partial [[Clostridium] fimetarium]|nr:HU family DNA-binding protein [[Clostridium] fimetarium]